MSAPGSPNTTSLSFASRGNIVPRFLSPQKILHGLVSLLCLGMAVYLLDWQTIQHTLLRVQPQSFGLIVGVSFCQFVVMSLRWHTLIQPIVPMPLRTHIQLYCYSIFLNTFTPANLGGDVYRVMALKPHATSSTAVITAIIQERYVGLLGFCCCYLVCWSALLLMAPRGALGVPHLFSIAGMVILLATAGLLLAPFVLHSLSVRGEPRLPGWCRALPQRLLSVLPQASGAHLSRLVGLSLLAVFAWVLTVQMVAYDLGLQISWLRLGMIVVLVELCRLVPISIQGIGVREGAYAYLFAMIGESSEHGFLVGTMSYLALNLSICLAGMVGVGCWVGTKPSQIA